MPRVSSLVAAAYLVPTLIAGGQVARPAAQTFRVAGSIADSAGVPITGVGILLVANDGSRHALVADTLGRFRFPAIPLGRAEISARRMGYQPATEILRVGYNDGADSVHFVLAVMVVELTGVDVTARSAGAPAEFYERMRENSFGRYLDHAQIKETFGQQPSEALRMIPGIVISPNRRGIGNIVRMRGCRPTIWVNGMRATGAELDEVGTVSDLAGIEIYSSAVGLPAKYVDRSNLCGAILLWSRNR